MACTSVDRIRLKGDFRKSSFVLRSFTKID